MDISVVKKVHAAHHSRECGANMDILLSKSERNYALAHLEQSLQDISEKIAIARADGDLKRVAKLVEKRACVAQTLARAQQMTR